MHCRKCNSENVSVEFFQSGGRTAKHGTGLGGNINNTARAATAIATLGVSNIVWKKSKGTERMKYKKQKIAICHSCGYDWNIK